MADPDRFELTALMASGGSANKSWRLRPDGSFSKGDMLPEKRWRIASAGCPNDQSHVADFLRRFLPRREITTVHGAPAPGIRPTEYHPRWSSEDHGADATIVTVERAHIAFDADRTPWPEGSSMGAVENIVAQAEYIREKVLPAPFRDAELVVRASSSTGFYSTFGSLHIYALLERLVPLTTQYKFLKGMAASGLLVDPRVALPGQPFHSARPDFIGLSDPVPEHLRVFVLPGLKRYVRDIDWDQFEPQRIAREATEQRARAVGAKLGWRAVLDNYLGDGAGRLGFFAPLTAALSRAALSDEPEAEIVSEMAAIVVAHPDYSSRRGQYTAKWLRAGLRRLRSKDTAREARIAELRGALFPTMRFDR